MLENRVNGGLVLRHGRFPDRRTATSLMPLVCYESLLYMICCSDLDTHDVLEAAT